VILLVSGTFGFDWTIPARRYLRCHIIVWHDRLYGGFFSEPGYTGCN
jgi:hypothetical protein